MFSWNRCGSTTTRWLTGGRASALYLLFGNGGDPLKSTIKALKDLYSKMPRDAKIVNSVVADTEKGCGSCAESRCGE